MSDAENTPNKPDDASAGNAAKNPIDKPLVAPAPPRTPVPPAAPQPSTVPLIKPTQSSAVAPPAPDMTTQKKTVIPKEIPPLVSTGSTPAPAIDKPQDIRQTPATPSALMPEKAAAPSSRPDLKQPIKPEVKTPPPPASAPTITPAAPSSISAALDNIGQPILSAEELRRDDIVKEDVVKQPVRASALPPALSYPPANESSKESLSVADESVLNEADELKDFKHVNTTSSSQMQQRLTQGVFDEMLRQHSIWIDSQGKQGKRANLYREDLRSIDFSHADLRGANMRGAILNGANLTSAQLGDADLAEASLENINAAGVNFQHANLAGSDMSGAILQSADLSYCDAMGVNFYQANLQRALMPETNLRDANLAQANISDALIASAMCRGIDLTRTRCINTDFSQSELRDAICNATELVNCNLRGTSFRDVTFTDVSFAESDFTVALDIPAEFQNVGFQLEKESLELEKHELKALEADVQDKQQEVMAMKLQMEEQSNLIQSLASDERVYLEGLVKIKKRLGVVRIIWIILLLVLLAVTGLTVASLNVAALNMVELSVLVGVPLLVFVLFLFTLGQVSAAAKRVEHHMMIRQRKLTALEKNQTDAAYLVPTYGDSGAVPRAMPVPPPSGINN